MENINQPGRYKCINIPEYLRVCRSNCDVVRDHFDRDCIVDIVTIDGIGDGYTHNDHDALNASGQLVVCNSEWELFELVENRIL